MGNGESKSTTTKLVICLVILCVMNGVLLATLGGITLFSNNKYPHLEKDKDYLFYVGGTEWRCHHDSTDERIRQIGNWIKLTEGSGEDLYSEEHSGERNKGIEWWVNVKQVEMFRVMKRDEVYKEYRRREVRYEMEVETLEMKESLGILSAEDKRRLEDLRFKLKGLSNSRSRTYSRYAE